MGNGLKMICKAYDFSLFDGSPVMSEHDVCKRIGVSRIVVQRALKKFRKLLKKRLISMGYIEGKLYDTHE